MANKKMRVSIGMEFISKSEELKIGEKLNIFYDSIKKAMLLRGKDANEESDENVYWLASHTIDPKGRINVPFSIRKAFPEATYLPAVQNGRIYILIIEHQKKSE